MFWRFVGLVSGSRLKHSKKYLVIVTTDTGHFDCPKND